MLLYILLLILWIAGLICLTIGILKQRKVLSILGGGCVGTIVFGSLIFILWASFL